MTMRVTAVVLAAGRATRMGAQKLLLPFRGKPMLARALDACAHLPTVVVVSDELASFADKRVAHRITNDAPERGMSYSLALADRTIEPDMALLVLLGDKPLVDRSLVDLVIAQATTADVCFPRRADGTPGHPVYFSPAARARLRALPPGDTLARLRDDAALVRAPFPYDEPGAYADVDTLDQYTRLTEG